MLINKNNVFNVLSALGDQLLTLTFDTIEIVVCGGSALQALGLIDRTTRDVDILAIVQSNGKAESLLLSAEPLPKPLIEAAKTVGRDFGLPSNWLNAGPTDLLTEGLPEGLIERLHQQSFGPKLTVYFIDRFDQICFKSYAAVNGGGMHHLTDLRSLSPSDEEMLRAAQWMVTQDAAEFFPDMIRSFLTQIGYPDVAVRL